MNIIMQTLENKSVLLVISGGIAAYKSLELIRLIKKSGGTVRCILTDGGAQFITPLSVSSLTGEETYTNLWALRDDASMAHIKLSREADLIVVAPASADFMAKMAQGRADDLASTTLLAADKPVMIVPGMNPEMWAHPATQANVKILKDRGIKQVGPTEGDMACGETGLGRMAEPEEIFDSILSFFFERPLKGFTALVTSGPTYEPIDPVRFIGNRSSGKQGHAIAAALFEAGADVTLITGPVNLKDPNGVKAVHVESAKQMLSAVQGIKADIAVCAAAVSDWAPEAHDHKIKKREGKTPPDIKLNENPDILHNLSTGSSRPRLVVGFAAETENLLQNAKEKLARKKCDWILANDVSQNAFGSDENHVYLVTNQTTDEWPESSKRDIARKLVTAITEYLTSDQSSGQIIPLKGKR